MAVSDSPVDLDLGLLRERLRAYGADGRPAAGPAQVEEALSKLSANLEPREKILARTRDLLPVTDDNMGTEWAGYPER